MHSLGVLLKSCNNSAAWCPAEWGNLPLSLAHQVPVYPDVRIVRIAHCSTCSIGAEIDIR